MKKQFKSTRSEHASPDEAKAFTDLPLAEASAEQIKGGPAVGNDLLIGGLGGDMLDGGSRHSGGVNASLGDGSVKFVKDSINI